jgi:hypothetical protein
MSFYLKHPIDFLEHNEEVKRVWDAFDTGKEFGRYE